MFQMTDKCKPVLKEVQQYTAKCLEVCWLMNMCDTPLAIGSPPAKGSVFDNTIYKVYKNYGKTVDYVVWLPLYLHKNGPLLQKGVVQPISTMRVSKLPTEYKSFPSGYIGHFDKLYGQIEK